MNKTDRITIRLDEETRKKLEKVAKDQNRSLANLIRLILAKYL